MMYSRLKKKKKKLTKLKAELIFNAFFLRIVENEQNDPVKGLNLKIKRLEKSLDYMDSINLKVCFE